MLLAAAALVPIAVFLALTWRREDRREAMIVAAFALLYAAPYVVLQGTPVPLDYLYEVSPWKAAMPAGYLQKNHLLNDVVFQMVPWQEAVRAHWAAGALPLFDRSTGSGTALWTNPQAAVLFPTTVASLLFGSFAAPLCALVMKLLAASWGMFLLLGRFGLSRQSRVFGAVAFAYCAFSIAFAGFPLTNVTAVLPLFMFTLHGAVESWRGAAKAALVLLVLLAAGHPETILHAAFVAIPYAAWLVIARPRGERITPAVRIGTAGVAACLMAAPLLLPFAAQLPHTERRTDLAAARAGVRPPPLTAQALIPFVVPDYFGNPRVHNYRGAFNFNEYGSQYCGLAALALAIAAVAAAPRRHAFWTALFAALFVLTFMPDPAWSVVSRIPLLNVALHGRLRFALALIVAILAAHGFELLQSGASRRPIAVTAALMGVGVIAICLASYPLFAQFGIRRLIFFTELAALASLALVLWCALRRESVGYGLVALLFADLVTVAPMYNPANSRDLFYPVTPSIAAMQKPQAIGPVRVVGLRGALQPMTPRFFGLEDVRAHDPMTYAPYSRLLIAAGLDRSDYFARFDKLPPRPLLDFLGVRFIVSDPGHEQTGFPLEYSGADANVYRNDRAMPRYFVPARLEHSADPASAFLQGSGPTHVYSAALPAGDVAPARVQLARYGQNGSTIVVNAGQETFVASSEVALPGWRLERNGQRWPEEVINGVFLGWRVPPGTSTFTLDYRPPLFTASWIASIAGLALLVAMLGARASRPQSCS